MVDNNNNNSSNIIKTIETDSNRNINNKGTEIRIMVTTIIHKTLATTPSPHNFKSTTLITTVINNSHHPTTINN